MCVCSKCWDCWNWKITLGLLFLRNLMYWKKLFLVVQLWSSSGKKIYTMQVDVLWWHSSSSSGWYWKRKRLWGKVCASSETIALQLTIKQGEKYLVKQMQWPKSSIFTYVQSSVEALAYPIFDWEYWLSNWEYLEPMMQQLHSSLLFFVVVRKNYNT